MAEVVRSFKVTVEIETNKRTIVKEFDTAHEAIRYLRSEGEELDNDS